jgi:DNA-binding response OmpR family regulator
MNTEEQVSVLLVEDNPLTLRVLIEHLRKLGLQTSVARSGEEALRQIGGAKPDLILLDIMLPGIDGFETCHRLKGNVTTKEIPVIFITALSDTTDKVKAFEAGGVDYITKPIDFREVAARIETRLTIQRLQRRLKARGAFLSSGSRAASEEQKATILVVEDNPMTLQLLVKYLDGLNFNSVGVKKGEEALQYAEMSPPDLILLDVMLPGIDGFDTCSRLKNNSATCDIPVIFMTALSETADKVKAFEAGAVDYITKPHQYAEVAARIKTHLTLQTLQRQLRKPKR